MNSEERSCDLSNACTAETEGHKFGDLFKNDWEVFVIRHDKETGRYSWFTQCCEVIANKFGNGNNLVSAIDR